MAFVVSSVYIFYLVPNLTSLLALNFSSCLNKGCNGGRCSDLMISSLISGARGPGSNSGQGHRVVFLGKTLNSHSGSLHPGL